MRSLSLSLLLLVPACGAAKTEPAPGANREKTKSPSSEPATMPSPSVTTAGAEEPPAPTPVAEPTKPAAPAPVTAPTMVSEPTPPGVTSSSSSAPSDAESKVAKNRWRFKACYNKALAKDPDISGSGMPKFTVVIAAGGKVKSIKVLCSQYPKELTDCVVQATIASLELEPGTHTLGGPC